MIQLYRKPKKAPGPPPYYTPEQIKKYWRNRRSHELRVERTVRARMWLIDQLGGPTCRIPGCEAPELTYKTAEIHHKHGRAEHPPDNRKPPQEKRIKELIELYKREPNALTIACSACNKRIGNPNRNQVDDVPF